MPWGYKHDYRDRRTNTTLGKWCCFVCFAQRTTHIHTHKYTPGHTDIVAKAEGYLGGPMEAGACVVHTVRDVAPNKLMLCLSFRVPKAVAFNSRS